MASYHCTVKVGGKGKAAAHAAYIAREGQYSGRSRYEDLEATAYGNMPSWAAHNPAHFWQAADEHERANGATYREIEIALPRELNPAQRRELVEAFVRKEIGDRHAYQWAIHTPKAALEKGEQPHAHIMYSERTRDGLERDPAAYFKRYNAKAPERGGCRKDSAGTEERLQATRERWAMLQNTHLERYGFEVRVDHRSLKDQGIDRAPETHIGASRIQDMAKADISALIERRAAENEQHRAQGIVDAMIDISNDLKTLHQEKNDQQKRELAEQQRLANMSAIALQVEIDYLRPSPITTVLDRDPAVIAVWQEKAALEHALRDADKRAKLAEHQMSEWRKEHPWRARLHDRGFIHAKALTDYEQQHANALQKKHVLPPQIEAAMENAKKVERFAMERIKKEQEPMHQHIEKLEILRQHKLEQEQQKQRHEKTANEAIAAFKTVALKREMKASDYTDMGKKWNALPEATRQGIDSFNQLPKEAQNTVLQRMREKFAHDHDSAKRLVKQFDHHDDKNHSHDYGMGR